MRGSICAPAEKEHVMRLSAARAEQAMAQFEAQAIPDTHPAVPQLKGLYGDHTFFLASNGLNIVEPIPRSNSGVQTATVVNLANWTDESATSLAPHEPEATDLIVELAGDEPDLH
jgi:hypothetical protein